MSALEIDPLSGLPLPARGMFNTNWTNPVWMAVAMENSSNGREAEPGGAAGQGGAQHAVFNFGTNEHPCRCFIVKFEPGAVIHPHDHPTDYCSIVVEGSIEMRGETFTVGDIRFVKADTMYGPINIGPHGATLLEFHPGPLDPVFDKYSRRVFTGPWIRGGGSAAA